MSVNNENVILGGHSITSSLQILSKSMSDVSASLLKVLLKLVFDAVAKKPLPPKALEKINKKGDIDSIEQLFGGLLILVQTILRIKPDELKEADIRSTLKTLKFTEDCSNEFINMFLENKTQLYANRRHGVHSYYLKLRRFDWRIDITISSSSLSKSFNTVIIVKLTFTNGEARSFELTIAKFHLLRLYVASMLKEMNYIEKKGSIKV